MRLGEDSPGWVTGSERREVQRRDQARQVEGAPRVDPHRSARRYERGGVSGTEIEKQTPRASSCFFLQHQGPKPGPLTHR